MHPIASRITRECRVARSRKAKPATEAVLKAMRDQIDAMVSAGKVTHCPTVFVTRTLQVDP